MGFRSPLPDVQVTGGTIDTITGRVSTALEVRPDIQIIHASTNVDDQPAGAIYNLTFLGEAGFFDTLIGAKFLIPASDGTSGNHIASLDIEIDPGTYLEGMLYGSSNYSTAIHFFGSTWSTASIQKLPGGGNEQLALHSCIATDNRAVRFHYSNNTDGTVNGFTVQTVWKRQRITA